MNTCVRLPGGNRVISHVSVCEVLKQSALLLNQSLIACHLLYIYKETFPNSEIITFHTGRGGLIDRLLSLKSRGCWFDTRLVHAYVIKTNRP